MATFTAQILVGHDHIYHGGIVPTHYLLLSENSRPAWILQPFTEYTRGVKVQRITWIPTVKNMLEDAMLMIVLNVFKVKEIVEVAQKYFAKEITGRLELYEDIEPNNLKDLYNRCRSVHTDAKVVVTALQGSTILRQLDVLKEYNIDCEVCTTSFSKSSGVWR